MAVYRNSWERIQDEWKTFRAMSFRQKIRHLLSYEKHLLLVAAVLLLLGLYGYDVIQMRHQEIVLQGFFTNDEPNYFPAQKLQKEYAQYLNIKKSQRVAFEDSLYIDQEGNASTYSSASNGKVIAYMAAHELDFIVTEGSVADYYMGYLPLKDLANELPADLLQRCEGLLRTGVSETGEEGFYALSLRGSRWVPEDSELEFDFLVPATAPRPEEVWNFLRYAFEMETEGVS